MSRFIITLMSVALLGGVMGMLSPEGDTKKYVRLVASLCLLCALAAPIFGLLSDGDIDFEGLFSFSAETDSGYEEIYKEALASGARESAEAAIKNKLTEHFELPDESLDIELAVEYDGEKYNIKSARVLLHSSAVFADPREISAFVNEACGCACSVEYD